MSGSATQTKPTTRTRVGAYAIVLQEDEILLCRISAELPHLEGQWTLPGGGLDFQEHPKEAVVREVKEETGLDVEITQLVTVDSVATKGASEHFHGIRIIYFVQVVGGVLSPEVGGTTDLCEWHPLATVSELPLTSLATLGIQLAWTSN